LGLIKQSRIVRAGYWNIVAQVSFEQTIGNLCGHRRCSPFRMALHVSYKSLTGWWAHQASNLGPDDYGKLF
jgi:hypothetical protein